MNTHTGNRYWPSCPAVSAQALHWPACPTNPASLANTRGRASGGLTLEGLQESLCPLHSSPSLPSSRLALPRLAAQMMRTARQRRTGREKDGERKERERRGERQQLKWRGRGGRWKWKNGERRVGWIENRQGDKRCRKVGKAKKKMRRMEIKEDDKCLE